MTIETRIREHLAAKAATIPADPPPRPAPRPPLLRWRPALAIAAAVVVALVVGAGAWLFRTAETVDPVTPDLEELTPTLQGPLLDWTLADEIEPGRLAGIFAVEGDVVVFGARLVDETGRPPLRVWRAATGEPLAELPVAAEHFGPRALITRVVWDGERFLAFGGRFSGGLRQGAGELATSLAWSSQDGLAWEEHALTLPEPAADASPYVARSAVVVDAAASARGAVVAVVASDAFDWEAYLTDRLGGAYEPGSLRVRDYDGVAGVYRLFDADDRLLLEVTRDEIGYDANVANAETVVLYSADGRDYRPVDIGVPAGGLLSVQATDDGLYVLAGGGPGDAAAWTSTDGDSWQRLSSSVDGLPLEPLELESWRGLLLGVTVGEAARTVVASSDGSAWLPISPPLLSATGGPLPMAGVAADGGLFAYGFEFQLGSGPEEVIVRSGGYRVFSYPRSARLIVTPLDSSEAALVASLHERGPSGLPAGFEPGPDGSVRAIDPDTGDVLLSLAAEEWDQLTVDAEPDTVLARGWYSPDGEQWGAEDLAAAFGAPGLVQGAAVGGGAVVVLFQADPPANMTTPLPGVALQLWVGRPR